LCLANWVIVIAVGENTSMVRIPDMEDETAAKVEAVPLGSDA